MGRPTTWSPERDEELRQIIDRGGTFQEASQLLGMSLSSLYNRYARVYGPVPVDHRGVMWTPEKVETVRKMVDENKSDRIIGEHFGVTRYAIEGLRVRIGLERGSKKHRPAPEGFAEIAPTKTRYQLTLHYKAHQDTIDRWCKAAGVAFMPVPAVKPPKARPANYSTKLSSPVVNTMSRPFLAQREGGTVGEAVFQLQRAGMSVYRLKVVKPSAPMDMWVVGARRLHEADMIKLAAERYGMKLAA